MMMVKIEAGQKKKQYFLGSDMTPLSGIYEVSYQDRFIPANLTFYLNKQSTGCTTKLLQKTFKVERSLFLNNQVKVYTFRFLYLAPT